MVHNSFIGQQKPIEDCKANSTPIKKLELKFKHSCSFLRKKPAPHPLPALTPPLAPGHCRLSLFSIASSREKN